MKEKTLSNDSKKELAKLLYTREGITSQKELAARVGVTEKTMGTWVKDGGWEKLKKNFLLTREEQMADLLNELSEINAYIKKAPAGLRFADSKLGDVRRKLVRDLKDLETKAALPEIIHACTGLLDFIRKIDLTKAQEFSKYVDAYIKNQLR